MKKLVQLFLLILSCMLLSGCVVQVEDGEVGVKNDFGHIRDEALNAGWHFFLPAVTRIELWNVKIQELKERALVPSSEGLISQLDMSILYQIPAQKASVVRKTIGPDYVTVVVEPYVREAIRNVASGYAVKALYSEAGRKEIGKNILDFLKGKLDEKGIMIQDVLLRDVNLPASFSQSIEMKLKAEQEALQKEFELQKARKDAEIEVAKAEGVAKANQIIGDSLKNNDSYLKYLWIQALKDTKSQVIYVPTEAGLPILEASRYQTRKKTEVG